MKAAYVGLLLSLMGGVAMAQSAPSGAPTPPAQMPQSGANGPAAQAAPDNGMNGQMQRPPSDPNADSGTDGPYQGEIIQTPNGTYVVAQPPGGGDAMPQQSEGEDMEAQGPRPPGPPPHPNHRMPPMSKAAHFRIKGPDLALDIKCPDDEPVKACVDAASQLIDKAGTVHH